MAQLQDLGLLSFTPSREVEGQRINSYDDRYLHISLGPFLPLVWVVLLQLRTVLLEKYSQ